ncbi:DUF177 domain-containing protein [Chloroflexota bacterium]
MLRINVSQLLKESIGSTRNHQIHDIIEINNEDSPVNGEVTLTRTNRSILVKGKLQVDVNLTCSRCLNPFSYPLKLKVEDEYFMIRDIFTEDSLPLPNEPGYFTIDKYNVIDLTEVIHQYAVLNIPMKPLCQKDCAGLCPSCGYNLNKGKCNCPPQPADPRWSELSKLVLAKNKTKLNNQKGTE